MKRNAFSIILAAVLSLIGAKTMAYDIAIENAGVTIYYNYINNETELEVTYSNSKYSGVIIIPEKVTYMDRTRKVTSIGHSAFYQCTGLVSVTIPQSVTSIGHYAFEGCTSLASICIPNSVTSIGHRAFPGCSSLASIVVEDGNTVYDSRDGCNAIIEISSNQLIAGCKKTVIPNSVTSIGGAAFSGCSSLSTISIPNSVTSIGEGAFSGCTSLPIIDSIRYADTYVVEVVDKTLSTYTIKKGTRFIGDNAFSCCQALIGINIPESVTSIGDFAFQGCTSLTSITIPNSVTSINHGSFSDCSGLTSISIPNSVTNIGGDAFSGCASLTSISIPNSVTSIGDSPFIFCSNLTSVTIPGSVTSIGANAFGCCENLSSVTIEEGVTSIAYSMFYSCSSLTSILIPNSVTSIEDEAFDGCRSLTSISIPNSVTTIGNRAFYDCALTSVTIGKSVTSIGDEAFSYNPWLTEVISKIENPFSIDTNSFEYYATLYVPIGTLDKYRATAGWQNFANIEEIGEQCATPTIAFVNGKVHFACETEGVEFVSSLTCTPQQQQNNNELELGATFTVSVYATKEGYFNSDVATATIDLSNTGDVNGDGEVNVSDVTTIVSIILGNNP